MLYIFNHITNMFGWFKFSYYFIDGHKFSYYENICNVTTWWMRENLFNLNWRKIFFVINLALKNVVTCLQCEECCYMCAIILFVSTILLKWKKKKKKKETFLDLGFFKAVFFFFFWEVLKRFFVVEEITYANLDKILFSWV